MAQDPKQDAKPQEPERKAVSLPNHADPETARFLAACRERFVFVKDTPQPAVEFCRLKGCGYPLVPRSNFTGQPGDNEPVCSWDPSHPQG